MKKIIIAFVGEIASGKGLAADYLISKTGAGYYRFSQILKDLAERLHLPVSRDILIRMSEIMREHFGEDVLAKVMAKDVEENPSSIIIVDGVRRLADIEYLKQLDGFHLIHITAPIETRYERVKNRGEKAEENNLTFEQFQKDALRSTEQSIKEVAQHATRTIANDGTIEQFHQQLDSLIKELTA